MTSSLAGVYEAEAEIHNLMWGMDPTRTREYISSLDVEIRAHPVVAIAVAMVHIGYGDYCCAAAAIEATQPHKLFSRKEWILDEDVACLALISAVIEAYRELQLGRLITAICEVEDVYINLANKDGWRKGTEEETRSWKTRICAEADFLNQTESGENQIDNVTLSDARLRLEFGIMHARWTAAEMGLASQDDFTRRYVQRHKIITKYLRHCGRLNLEAFFIFVSDTSKRLGGVPAAINFFTDYLQDLHVDFYGQRASTLINICVRQVTESPDLAAISLDEALAIFVEKNHGFGQMVCEFHRINLFQLKSHAPANCLEQLLSLADRFLKMDDFYWYWLSSAKALRIVVKHKSFLDQFVPLTEALRHQLQKSQNRYMAKKLDIWEAYDWSQHGVSVEQARLKFEEYLADGSDKLTPYWLSDIYHGLYTSYTALVDHEKATEYANKYFDLHLMYEQFSLQARSVARHTLAESRLALLKSRLPGKSIQLRSTKDVTSLAETKVMCKTMACAEVSDLESWIQTDTEHCFDEQVRDKRVAIRNFAHYLEENFSEEIHSGKIVLSSQGTVDKINSGQIVRNLGDLMRLSEEGRGQEGIRLAKQELQRKLRDPAATIKQRSHAYYLCALAYDLATWHKTRPNKVLSSKEKNDYLELQVGYLREQRDLCKAIGDYHSLLQSAFPFQKFMQSYMLLHPELKSDLLLETERFFQDAERATEMYRRSSLRSHDIATLLRMQKVVSAELSRIFYSNAALFYIAMQDAPSAWTWVQKSRARALFDMATRHHASANTMLAVLERDPPTRDLLASESKLATEAQKATAADYWKVKEGLQSQRQKLMAVPVLEELLGKPVTKDSFGFSEAAAIYYHVRDWVPKGANVVLVNWFVEPSGWICLMSMDCRQRMVRIRARLAMRLSGVRKWVHENLSAENGVARLETVQGALKDLRLLVEALSFMTQPEDLLVLSPPAELAAIPLHGIPIGDEGPMIQRNPVVYASSFSLYLECICRVQVCESPRDRSLSSAVFTATYEEPEYWEERAKVLNEVQELSNSFGAKHILGHHLTAATFKYALNSSPWVHYHGHAEYDGSEVLNQCYVLSSGEELCASDINLEKLTINGSVLRNLILSNTRDDLQETNANSAHKPRISRLTVPEIFAMNLRETKPFVCSIACDSGVQDVAEGDEPLGLVSALICAGASSVLGTLWPIPSQTGRMFSKHFYTSLAKQIKEPPLEEPRFGRVLNVARAVREAVLAIKKEKKEPYFWASFALHGAGFYRVAQPVERIGG